MSKIKGGVVYEPGTQALEYAPLATNHFIGCGHRCKYCYVPNIPGQPDRKTFDAGAIPKPNYMERLAIDARRLEASGETRQILFCFATDPYHPGDTTLTRQALTVLRDGGLGFCTLTKGGTRALRDIDLFRPGKDAFACSLTSLDVAFRDRWEPGAAEPADRLAALRAFHRAGIFTWSSLEPTIDTEASLSIIDATHEFVDLYKVGRANDCGKITRETDWRGYTLAMIERLAKVGAAYYIKKDLQPFLPPGFPNPMRVQQHH